jgi:hypothetical protein
MTTQIPGTTGTPRAKMRAVHMLLLIVGVLLAGGSQPLFRNTDYWALGLVAVAAGVVLILLGAVGLGRSISSQSDPAQNVLDDSGYPAQLEGILDPTLSRGMWLVKWLLAVPHYIVLAILWSAFPVVVLASGLMILFTGRYPVALFEFVVGVLRWNWRVAFYATGVLGTDKYPPFTLARTDYPATFDVSYPARLSRWKVLVKSWLLAFPHLIIVSVLAGVAWATVNGQAVGGLLGLLVFIAGLILLFTKVYNLGLFNLVMGIQRWVYRVFAYTSLLRDDYPPFRLDQGPLDSHATA